MNTQHATPADFDRWTENAKRFNASTLDYIIRDCIEAADAMESQDNPARAGYYRDQAATYRAALNAR